MTLNRLSGLVVASLAILLIFWIIPNHTEVAEFSSLEPSTLPYITAGIALIMGLLQLIFPSGKAEFNLGPAFKVAFFFAVSLAGLYIMSLVGFLIAAPLLVLVVMMLIGERRPLWLISGIVIMPLVMWASVEILLNWPLP
jgi:putative tricarboxylic transport membrane protein